MDDKSIETFGKNRSVMPFDVLGRTRATLVSSTSITLTERSRGILAKLTVIGIVYCNF